MVFVSRRWIKVRSWSEGMPGGRSLGCHTCYTGDSLNIVTYHTKLAYVLYNVAHFLTHFPQSQLYHSFLRCSLMRLHILLLMPEVLNIGWSRGGGNGTVLLNKYHHALSDH